jgi:UDP-N-acetylmuramate dehydrogenase
MLMPACIQKNVSLKPLTTFRVGGPAKYYYTLKDEAELSAILSWCKTHSIPFLLLGKGSNVVFSDLGFEGLIIHIGKAFSKITVQHNSIVSEAGAIWSKVVTTAIDHGWAGIQNTAGIPGTVGGAVRMNAGAYGQELVATASRIQVMDFDGKLYWMPASDCQFSYRSSLFATAPLIVLRLEQQFRTHQPKELLQQQKTECLTKRKASQPLQYPNAGSMFKNPPHHFAGALIEQCGLKGYQIGQAAVSTMHANFLINLGDATANEVFSLKEHIIKTVQTHTGVVLQTEPLFMGQFETVYA